MHSASSDFFVVAQVIKMITRSTEVLTAERSL